MRHYTLAAAEAEILEAILSGAMIGDAIGQFPLPVDFESFAADLQRWFHEWRAEGFFLRVEFDDAPCT